MRLVMSSASTPARLARKARRVAALLRTVVGANAASVPGERGRRACGGTQQNPEVDEGAEAAERLPSGRSGEHAVDKNVDGEIKPLIAIASDHVRSMGSEMRESVGRQADEGLIELVDLLAVPVTALPGRAPYIVLTGCADNQQHEDVARPGGVLRVKPTGQKNAEQVFGQTQNRFGRG